MHTCSVPSDVSGRPLTFSPARLGQRSRIRGFAFRSSVDGTPHPRPPPPFSLVSSTPGCASWNSAEGPATEGPAHSTHPLLSTRFRREPDNGLGACSSELTRSRGRGASGQETARRPSIHASSSGYEVLLSRDRQTPAQSNVMLSSFLVCFAPTMSLIFPVDVHDLKHAHGNDALTFR